MTHTSSGPGTIVVAVDGSPASVAALRYARRLGRELRLDLVAVIATDDREPWDWTYPYQGFDPLADAARHLGEVLDEAFAGEEHDDIRALALRGRAVDAVTAYARDASLLVVGKRRHHALVGALLGSVAAGCAARATCPVVLVAAETPQPAGAPAEAAHATAEAVTSS